METNLFKAIRECSIKAIDSILSMAIAEKFGTPHYVLTPIEEKRVIDSVLDNLTVSMEFRYRGTGKLYRIPCELDCGRK